MPVHSEVPPVEINASPERVREVVLDFARMPEWHSNHFTSIKVLTPNKQGKDLVEGDKLEVVLTKFTTFSPVIVENSPSRFRWKGSLPGIFSGDHVFEFHPSDINPGGTKFVQYEDFSGALSFTMNPKKKSGQQNLDGFKEFGEDLKKRVEGTAASTSG